MTGNPSWSVLDLDDERLGDECVDIVERLGATGIKARLDFYDDWITKLFKPEGKLLAEAPTRVAQITAETLLASTCQPSDSTWKPTRWTSRRPPFTPLGEIETGRSRSS